MWCLLDASLFHCGFESWWVKGVGSVHRRLYCMSVPNTSDIACYLWFWNLETFWNGFHWPASSKHEHQAANGILAHDVMIYMTSSSSVQKAKQFASMGPHAWSFSSAMAANEKRLIMLCNHPRGKRSLSAAELPVNDLIKMHPGARDPDVLVINR